MKKIAGLLAAGMVAATALVGCAADDDEGEAAASASPSASMADDMTAGASATVGELSAEGFWVRESSLDLAAAFGTVRNLGAEDDALVGASAEGVPTVELHQTVDGVMQQVESFPVPADGELVLEPGANHIMFRGLTEEIPAGSTVTLTLEFASGESVTLDAPVRPFSTQDMMGGADGEMNREMNGRTDGDS